MYPSLNVQSGVKGQTTQGMATEKMFYLAPVMGTLHYGVIRLAVLGGIKTVASPLSLNSYISMHVIGSTFAAVTEKVGSLLLVQAGILNNNHDNFFRKCAWIVIQASVKSAQGVDLLYSKVFNIRRKEQADLLKPHQLSLMETVRKIFLETVIEQALYIASWELGKRGSELLLGRVIVTLSPIDKKVWIYVFMFLHSLFEKFNEFRENLVAEQKREFEEIFDPLKTKLIELSAEMIQSAGLPTDTDSKEVVALCRKLLQQPDLEGKCSGLEELLKEFEKQLKQFEQLLEERKEDWKYLQDTAVINGLDDFVRTWFL